MSENESVEKSKKPSPPRGGKSAAKSAGRYPFALRVRAVKLHLEEGFAIDLVAEELGVSHESVRVWLRRYRKEGEEGLKDRYTVTVRRSRLTPSVAGVAG